MHLFWILVTKAIPEQVVRSQTDAVFVELYAKSITTVNIQCIKTYIFHHNAPQYGIASTTFQRAMFIPLAKRQISVMAIKNTKYMHTVYIWS